MNKTNKTNTDNTFQQGLEGTGAGEWAKVSYNIAVGCPHNCNYCYARGNARHFNWIPSLEDWPNMRLIPERVAEAADKFCGTSVMYPSTHDITPEILPQALQTLRGLLGGGNSVLFVSKPHLEVIEAICREMPAHKAQLQFRFTIGSGNPDTCALWEPGAPGPNERIAALRHAFELGYQTSVSMEPMLEDNAAMCALVDRVTPFVMGTVWLGKLNGGVPLYIQAKPGIKEALRTVRAGQSDELILALHDRLAQNPKVRWKDSIKEVLRKHGRLPKLPNASAKVVDPKRRQAALKAHETMRRRRAALQGTSG